MRIRPVPRAPRRLRRVAVQVVGVVAAPTVVLQGPRCPPSAVKGAITGADDAPVGPLV